MKRDQTRQLVVLLAVAVALVACGPSDLPSAPAPVEIFRPIRLTPAAIIPANARGYQGVEIGENRLVFTWDGPHPLWVGAVVAGSDSTGRSYLAEIVTLRSIDERRSEAITRPAQVTDLIQSGHFIARFGLGSTSREGVAASPILQPSIDIGALSCSGSSTAEGPRVQPFVRPTINIGEVELQVSPRGLAACVLAERVPLSRLAGAGCDGVIERFQLRVDASISAGLRWAVERDRQVDCTVDPLAVAWPDVPIAPPIPVAPGVLITLHLRPVLSTRFSYHARAAASVEVGATVSLAGALRYEREQGWSHSFTRPEFRTFATSSAEAYLQGTASFDQGFEFGARVDWIAGPYIRVTTGFDSTWRTDLIACTQETSSGAHVGFDFGASAQFGGLGASVSLDSESFPLSRTTNRRALSLCSSLDAGSTIDVPSSDVGHTGEDATGTTDVIVDSPLVDAGGGFDAALDVVADRSLVDTPAPSDVLRDAGELPDSTVPPDTFRPECSVGESRSCGNCGTQSRACAAGRWGAWSVCGGEGVCSAGSTRVCPGTGVTVVCSPTCTWPTCPDYCGDGRCGVGESCATCAADCACSAGVCDRGACVACGGIDQACCASASCSASASVCFAGTCRHCGASSEPCCAGNVCSAGTSCDSISGTCQPASTSLWSTDFEGVSLTRSSGGRRLSNGIEIGDSGAPLIGSGGDLGYPARGQALAIYGTGAYQDYGAAWMALPAVLSTSRSATLSLWVRTPVDGPGDPRVWVQRGTCGARAFTVRRSLGWQQLSVDLAPCADGTGVVVFLGEIFEFPSSSPGLWIDDISVVYR